MTSDQINQAIEYLRSALRMLRKNDHKDPLKALRAAMDAHGHAQDAVRLIREQINTIHGWIDTDIRDLHKRSTDYDPVATPTE